MTSGTFKLLKITFFFFKMSHFCFFYRDKMVESYTYLFKGLSKLEITYFAVNIYNSGVIYSNNGVCFKISVPVPFRYLIIMQYYIPHMNNTLNSFDSDIRFKTNVHIFMNCFFKWYNLYNYIFLIPVLLSLIWYTCLKMYLPLLSFSDFSIFFFARGEK